MSCSSTFSNPVVCTGGIAGILFESASVENCFCDKESIISASVSGSRGTCIGLIVTDGYTGTCRYLYLNTDAGKISAEFSLIELKLLSLIRT